MLLPVNKCSITCFEHHLSHITQHSPLKSSDVSDVSGQCYVLGIMMHYAHFNCASVCGCTANKIGDVGAQSISDGLKSLASLETLKLGGKGSVEGIVLANWT